MKYDMDRLQRLLSLSAVLVLLAGCALGPNYERPSQLVPDQFRDPAAGQGDPVTTGTLMAVTPWWEVFHDVQLQALITAALENNQDLLAATARVEEARALLGTATSDLYPQLAASGAAVRKRTPDTMRSYVVPPSPALPEGVLSPPRSNAYSALLDLSYEVDLWGRVRRTREASRAELFSTEAARATVVSTLVTGVASSYLTLLELDRETQITSATLQARSQTLDLMRLRRKEGMASDLEVSRFLAEVAAAQASLAALEQQRVQTENALSVLLGRAPGQIERGIAFEQQTPAPSVPYGLPADLLDCRPDLRAAEQQLAAATARIGAAKAAFFPRIALTGQYGYQSSELDTLLEANSHGWMITGAVTQPIFEGGRNWFNYKATKARREQALQNYRKTVLEALREVSDALVARQQSALERQHLGDQADALGQSVRLSDLRYRSGQSSYLELLDAQQQEFAAQILLERARLSELLASVRLYKALGGGVQMPPQLQASVSVDASSLAAD